jgi:ketosteroid isomerase-like protein
MMTEAAEAGLARTGPMTDDERRALALEYLKAFDNGGQTADGRPIFDLFTDDCRVYFPKWGIADGKEALIRMFTDVGGTLKSILHHYDRFNWIMTGTDTFVCEGTSQGEHRDGPWMADEPAWGAGRWCDVFEVRDGRISRVFIYLDPDYAGRDAARYPWIAA